TRCAEGRRAVLLREVPEGREASRLAELRPAAARGAVCRSGRALRTEAGRLDLPLGGAPYRRHAIDCAAARTDPGRAAPGELEDAGCAAGDLHGGGSRGTATCDRRVVPFNGALMLRTQR